MPSINQLILQASAAFESEERSNQEYQWIRLARYIMPSQSGIFSAREALGSRKTQFLYDPEGITANNDLASSIQATLINPATVWEKIRYSSEELNNDKEAAIWLENANKRMLEAFAESNFYSEAGKAFKFWTGLGNGILRHEENDPKASTFSGFRFKALHLANVAWTENQHNIADKIFHKSRPTLRQLKEQFGFLPDTLTHRYENNPEETTALLTSIYPEGDGTYKISYIEMSSKSLMSSHKSNELNEYVLRWDTLPEEVIGRGPGHDAYPSIRNLNVAIRENMQSRALANRPPILVEDQNALTTIDLRPGHKTLVSDIEGIKPLQLGADTQSQLITEDKFKQQIRAIFLLDKLMLPPRTETGEQTAFEVARRIEQMARVIGPTLARADPEFLQPLVRRSFRMMYDKGEFGEVPPAVRESGSIDISISFDNPLSRSQKFESISATQQWLLTVQQLAQFDPSVLAAIKSVEIAVGTGKSLGVPEEYVESIAAAMKKIQDQAQANQRSQGLEQAKVKSEIDKNNNSGAQQ